MDGYVFDVLVSTVSGIETTKAVPQVQAVAKIKTVTGGEVQSMPEVETPVSSVAQIK